jgi:2-polyprenyl-3-methyl-5-hydroxy-6-metoxy-1,4-benzoquinol methylase
VTAEGAGPCRFCGGETVPAFAVEDRNRGVTAARFDYRRCRSCGTYVLAKVPADLGRYYPPAYYSLPTPSELDAADAAEAPKLELLGIAPAGRLVEIGSGPGQFALAARKAGFDVSAIEMDARCCEYLQGAGVRAVCSDRPEVALAALEPARAIVLWHVLEHLADPVAVLTAAAARLERGGVLAIATPNPQALQFRLLRSRWAHVDAPRHLFLVSFEALRAQAKMQGLVLKQVTTSDPAGIHWNFFGWEHALRLRPARRASTRFTQRGARLLARAVGPVERRAMNGAAYTAVFVKRGA